MNLHQGKGYTLEIVRVKGCGCNWAMKAVYHGESRYRPYRYKSEAIRNMDTWKDCVAWHFPREFYHNFYSAKELTLVESTNP